MSKAMYVFAANRSMRENIALHVLPLLDEPRPSIYMPPARLYVNLYDETQILAAVADCKYPIIAVSSADDFSAIAAACDAGRRVALIADSGIINSLSGRFGTNGSIRLVIALRGPIGLEHLFQGASVVRIFGPREDIEGNRTQIAAALQRFIREL